jgi:hypothetical protein
VIVRLVGDCLFWAVLFKITKDAEIWATFFHGKVMYVLIVTKMGEIAYNLGDFFHQLIWSPWLQVLASSGDLLPR